MAREDRRQEFEDHLNSDPDFNYSADEFDKWYEDFFTPEDDIEYSNQLINDFMGRKKPREYHKSLRMLAFVVSKAESFVLKNLGYIGYWDDCLYSRDLDTRFIAVVEFIRWRNRLNI